MPSPVKQIDLNLKRRIDPHDCTLDDFRSSDTSMRRCLEMAWAAAQTDLPVLLLGETGTGKTLLGRAIHHSSKRGQRPFVPFNAAALSETLLDSQLFGHEKGAFTGADRAVKGKFELADGGTLFIDEIADMNPAAQAKILRAVEYGEYVRLGSEKVQLADVRLVSATHVPKSDLLKDAMRRDLFYRLNGITVTLPPLRERPLDLPLLIAAEIDWASSRMEKKIIGVSREAALRLLNHSWPGNLRELNRVIRAAVALSNSEILGPESLLFEDEEKEPATAPTPRSQPSATPTSDLTLKSAEQRHIRWVMEKMGGNKRQTARALGISRSTLDRKLET